VSAERETISLLGVGDARGADNIAQVLAAESGIVHRIYYAAWKRYGRGAGPIRNGRMLQDINPQLVLAFHNTIERSRGTKDCMEQARKRGCEVWLCTSKTITVWAPLNPSATLDQERKEEQHES
jgi:hypothetical protein